MAEKKSGLEKLKPIPDAEILGQAFGGIIASKYRGDFEDLIAKHGIDKIDPQKWYPLERAFAFFRDLVAKGNTIISLVSIGIEIFEQAGLPDEVDSIPAGLHLLQAVNDINVRNMPPEDGYDVEELSDRHYRVVDRTAWPHDLIYGYLYGIARRFKPEDGHPIVERVAYMNEENPNASGAIYEVSW